MISMGKKQERRPMVGDEVLQCFNANNSLRAQPQAIAAFAIITLFSTLPNPSLPPLATASTITASWYGPGFHGRRTASGERFDQWAMTAAHRTLPFGTLVRVSYKGKAVVVRVNDRGPFIRGRSLDLSRGAAQRLRCHGTCRVSMTVVGRRASAHGRRR